MNAFFLYATACIGAISQTVSAQSISGSAEQVGGQNGLLAGFGGGGFDGIVLFLRERVLLLFVPIGIFLVVRSGLKLINSDDEGKLETAKRTIASVCVGMMLAYVSLRMVNAFYTPGGAWNPVGGAQILATEVGGVLNWMLVMLIAVAILMIVASAIKAVASFGKEENAQEVRQTVVGAITGVGIIMLSGAIKLTLGLTTGTELGGSGAPDASIIINKVIGIVFILLRYLALAAIAVIIYAGIMMVLNFGNDDQYNKAKSLVLRVAIGLTVVLLAGTAVIFVRNLIV